MKNWFNRFRGNNSSKVSYFELSVAGRREVNQDSSIILELNNTLFMAVADGMGGPIGGYIAGNIAINIAYDVLEREFNKKEKLDEVELKEILKNIYRQIQEAIKNQILKNPALSGMGTTFTCILIYKGRYAWGNIGDSRIYKFNNKSLIQLTEDHSYINDLKKENNNSVSDEMKESYSHLLTRCLDGGEDRPDIFPLSKDFEYIEKGDMFLLCSDGLIIKKGNIEKSIIKYLGRSKDITKTAKKIINTAYNKGSEDNITLILAKNFSWNL